MFYASNTGVHVWGIHLGEGATYDEPTQSPSCSHLQLQLRNPKRCHLFQANPHGATIALGKFAYNELTNLDPMDDLGLTHNRGLLSCEATLPQ